MNNQQTILVTGGSGFLGSRLIRELKTRGYTHIVSPPSADYDLTEQADVRRLFKSHQIDAVIHLAAVVGGIGANSAQPGRYFYNNLMMGTMLMEEARIAEVSKFVSVGTICSYPKFAPVPFNENDLWNGYPEETNAPYGLAKKMSLVQAQAYRQQYGFNAIHLMPVNLYGPGDNYDPQNSHVIPAIILKCLQALATGAEEIVLWGDGSPTREFLHVDDCARAIVMCAETYDGAEPLNIGCGQEISIAELASLIAGLCAFNGRIVFDTSKPNGQPRRRLDITRLQTNVGFKPTVSLEDGLREVVADCRKRLLAAPSLQKGRV